MNSSYLHSNKNYVGMYQVIQNIAYYKKSKDANQVLDLIVPWRVSLTTEYSKSEDKFPLIIFVQGSGWQSADNGFEIAQLSNFAKRGYIIAMVKHRNAYEGHPFPSYLVDVKCAIRFLKAHADEYAIDTNKVIGIGTSSGGNAIQLVGLTADDPLYETDDYSGISDKIDVVISCFGVSNVVALKDKEEFSEVTEKLKNDHFPKTLEKMSPLFQVFPNQSYPPFLLMHGSQDTLVPYHQMQEMARCLRKNNYDVDTVTVLGADHENDFWSTEVWNKISNFIVDHI